MQLALLIFLSSFYEQSVQEGWSDGPNALRPVQEWAGTFESSAGLEWSDPGLLHLSCLPVYPMLVDSLPVNNVEVFDIDQDGDPDFLALAPEGPVWFENLGGTGTGWLRHTTTSLPDQQWMTTTCLAAADVDGDGDPDIVDAYGEDDIWGGGDWGRLYWLENPGDPSGEWTEHFLTEAIVAPVAMSTQDIDCDGDPDILIGYQDEYHSGEFWGFYSYVKIYWNDGGGWSASTFNNWRNSHLNDVEAVDFDCDGDLDILHARNGTIRYMRNNRPEEWTYGTLCSASSGVYDLLPGDFDGDGLVDLVCSCDGGELSLFSNPGSFPAEWEHLQIDSDDPAREISAADFDGDGDLDILGAGWVQPEGSPVLFCLRMWSNQGFHWPCAEFYTDEADMGIPYTYGCGTADFDGNGTSDCMGYAEWPGVLWFDEVAFQAAGTLTSAVLSAGQPADWTSLEWSAGTPPGTAVSFRVRSSNDPSDMGAWSEPFSVRRGLGDILQEGTEFFQYMADLSSSEPCYSPSLSEVTLGWSATGGPPLEERLFGMSVQCPAGSALEVVLTGDYPGTIDVTVHDLSGRLVTWERVRMTQWTRTIFFEGLPAGLYAVRAASGETTASATTVLLP